MTNNELYELAENIGKEIAAISKAIDSEYWVRTGRNIPTTDFLPEIVAAVIYMINRTPQSGVPSSGDGG